MLAAPFLLVLQNQNGHPQRTIELAGYEIEIGRDDSCGVVVDDPSVSRKHCRLFRLHTAGGWRIEDLHSTNGTLVNGARLAGESKELLLGDEIRCGARTAVRLALTRPALDCSNGKQVGDLRGGAQPTVGGAASTCFPWLMMALLSEILREEHVRRRDAERRRDELQAEVHQRRELRRRLAETEIRCQQAEREKGDALKESEELRQKLRSCRQQIQEAEILTGMLRRRTEQSERE